MQAWCWFFLIFLKTPLYCQFRLCFFQIVHTRIIARLTFYSHILMISSQLYRDPSGFCLYNHLFLLIFLYISGTFNNRECFPLLFVFCHLWSMIIDVNPNNSGTFFSLSQEITFVLTEQKMSPLFYILLLKMWVLHFLVCFHFERI